MVNNNVLLDNVIQELLGPEVIYSNVTYNWEVTGGNIIGNQNTNAIQVQWGVVNTANVSVTIEAADGSCLQVATLQIVSGVEKLDANDITLFPNPAQQYIQIGYSDSRPETIEIMNLLGEQLYSGTFKSQLDVSRFANGMYVVSIWRNGVAETRRFEVQH